MLGTVSDVCRTYYFINKGHTFSHYEEVSCLLSRNRLSDSNPAFASYNFFDGGQITYLHVPNFNYLQNGGSDVMLVMTDLF